MTVVIPPLAVERSGVCWSFVCRVLHEDARDDEGNVFTSSSCVGSLALCEEWLAECHADCHVERHEIMWATGVDEHGQRYTIEEPIA